MKENVILDKSFDFAVNTVEIYKELKFNRKEYILSKQLLRAGTSACPVKCFIEAIRQLTDYFTG